MQGAAARPGGPSRRATRAYLGRRSWYETSLSYDDVVVGARSSVVARAEGTRAGSQHMITASIVRCWMQAASRRSIAVTEPPEAYHIDGQRTGLVTSPPGRPIRRDAACGPATISRVSGDDPEAALRRLARLAGRPSPGTRPGQGGRARARARRRHDRAATLGRGAGSAAGRGRKATEPPVDLASRGSSLPRAGTPAAREGDRARKDPDPTPPDQAFRPKRPRGRPRKAEVEPGPAPAPLPVPAPLWELRRKADRPVVAAGGDAPVSCARPPSRTAGTGEGARARAGGAPPVPERRGQEARAGAGGTTGLERPVRAYSYPASGRDRSSCPAAAFRGDPPVVVTPEPALGEPEPDAILGRGLSQRNPFLTCRL